MSENSFADTARKVKVDKLVRYIDRRFTDLGYDVQAQAGEVAAMLRDEVTEEEWKRHAILAGVNKPSADSVAMVIKEYEDRAVSVSRSTEPPMCRHTGTH
jgi:hypothetical protein